MSVMQDLAAFGAEGGVTAGLTHNLMLAFVSAMLAVLWLSRRQQRLRGVCVMSGQSPAARTPPANGLSALLQAPGALSAKPFARLARGLAPQPLRPAGLPPQGEAHLGLSQLSLRTTGRYRLFAAGLVLLSLLLILLPPLLLPALGEPSAPFRIFTHGLCLIALWHLFWARLWRLDYDSIGLSSRNRWLRPEARMWRALTAISSDGPFITLFHFADGLVMRVPNFISGRREMMQTARSWLRHEGAADRR